MYSGFLTPKHSATWIGTHQKFNKIAFKTLRDIVNQHPDQLGVADIRSRFPRLKLIQHFEGINGPDGIKVKSPAQNEEWHYYDPFDDNDEGIFESIHIHFNGLVKALRERNQDKAAFEASWLAHTLTDGLTPAHHYPYEKEMEEIRGASKDSRTSKRKKLIVRGSGLWDSLRKTWMLHENLMSTHISFEIGVTAAVLTNRLKGSRPSQIELNFAKNHGRVEVFKQYANEIGEFNIYGRYYDKGWTSKIGRDVRHKMSPLIVRTIVIAWWLALDEAAKTNE
jgi:hypothetical protein